MRKVLSTLIVVCLGLACLPAYATSDVPGCADSLTVVNKSDKVIFAAEGYFDHKFVVAPKSRFSKNMYSGNITDVRLGTSVKNGGTPDKLICRSAINKFEYSHNLTVTIHPNLTCRAVEATTCNR